MATAPSKGIWIPIGASTKELNAALAEAGIQLTQFKKKTDEAGQSVGGMLKEFKRDQVQQGRLVGFYVRELAEFTGMSNEAKSVVGGLGQTIAEAAAGGTAFAVAFELAKTVMGVVTEHLKKAEEEAQRFAKSLMDAAAEGKRKVTELKDEIDLMQRKMAGASDAQAKHAQEVDKVNVEFKKQITLVKDLEDEIAQLKITPYIGSENKITELTKQLYAAQTAAQALGAQLGMLNVKGAGAEGQKDREDYKKLDERNQMTAAKLEGELATARAAHLAERREIHELYKQDNEERRRALDLEDKRYNLEVATIKAKRVAVQWVQSMEVTGLSGRDAQDQITTDHMLGKINLMAKHGLIAPTDTNPDMKLMGMSSDNPDWAKYIPSPEKLADFRSYLQYLEALAAEKRRLAQIDQDSKERLQAYQLENGPVEGANPANMLDSKDPNVKITSFEHAMGELDKFKKSVRETQTLFTELGSGVATVFSSIGQAIGGTAGQFVAQIGQMIAQVLALIVALATSDALEMGPAGLFAAIPAAAGILASVIGMIASISGREMGGDVNRNEPYIVGEVGPELFVPSTAGTIVPHNQLAADGGGGTIVINTFDSKSFDDYLHNNRSSVLRTVRALAREGRI